MKINLKDSAIYRVLNKEITVEGIIGSKNYEKINSSGLNIMLGDWSGLATNKVILGVYMDAQAGLLPGTSALARLISLGVHSLTSPAYTWVRNNIYKYGNITSDRSTITKYGADLLAFNLFQTPVYVAQIATAMAIRAAVDDNADFDWNTVANGALQFFKNSCWLGPAGKWSMDASREFFGAKKPDQLADNSKLEERINQCSVNEKAVEEFLK